MYQAGIENIILYENKGIAFTYYDPSDLSKITNLTSSGEVIIIENLQRPKLDIELKFKSGQIGHNYKIEFNILGLNTENYDELFNLMTSIYGWCFLVKFYDGTYKFFNTPVFGRDNKINPSDSMHYEIMLENPVPSLITFLNYDPDVSTVPVYRADTTLITADTTLITADYAL